MAKRSRIPAIVSWGGACAAGLVLLFAVLFPSEYLNQEVPTPWFRIAIRLDACELDLPLSGDLATLPPWWRPGWRERVVVGINDRVWLAVGEAVGVPARGWQLRLHVATWWLVMLLLLPGTWRWARASRAKRAALLAGRCTTCGYDLRGSGDLCPECGSSRTNESVGARFVSARMWQRRPWFTIVAMLSLLIATSVAVLAVLSSEGYSPVVTLELPSDWKFQVDRGVFSLGNEDALFTPRWRWRETHWLGLNATVVHGVTKTYYAFGAVFIYPLLFALIMPLMWWRTWWRDWRMIVARSCRWCWFDMEGATGPCPQCGRVR